MNDNQYSILFKKNSDLVSPTMSGILCEFKIANVLWWT